MAGAGPVITRLVLTGLGMAAISLTGRYVANQMPNIIKTLMDTLEKNAIQANNYGGFSNQMNINEAAKILGVSPYATRTEIKEAYKKVMYQNHPDKGGSPYIAAKINEAKDYLEARVK